MPLLSVLMIRAALLYLGVGFAVGGVLLLNKGLPVAGWLWLLVPIHVELLLFGWILQLAMGVAFWISPRFSGPPRYGRVWLAVLAGVLLNAGLWLSAAGQLAGNESVVLAGRLLLLAAGASFAAHLMPRLKPPPFPP